MTSQGFSAEAFKESCERIAKNAFSGCGLSDVLFSERLQDGIDAQLANVPEEYKEEAIEIAKKHGYDPDYEAYQAREGECSVTGIDEYCCPCGRHE